MHPPIENPLLPAFMLAIVVGAGISICFEVWRRLWRRPSPTERLKAASNNSPAPGPPVNPGPGAGRPPFRAPTPHAAPSTPESRLEDLEIEVRRLTARVHLLEKHLAEHTNFRPKFRLGQ